VARGSVAPKPLGDACHSVTFAFTQICSGFFFFNICWQSDFSEDQKWRVVRAHSVTFAPIRNFQRCQNPIFSIPPLQHPSTPFPRFAPGPLLLPTRGFSILWSMVLFWWACSSLEQTKLPGNTPTSSHSHSLSLSRTRTHTHCLSGYSGVGLKPPPRAPEVGFVGRLPSHCGIRLVRHLTPDCGVCTVSDCGWGDVEN